MRIEPFLYFNGRCEEAATFYGQAVGAEVTAMTRFKDVPTEPAPGGDGDKVLYASMRIGETTVMASDADAGGRDAGSFGGFSLSLTALTDDGADGCFTALAEGGQVQVPLMATPFASKFGMVADRFGVLWTISTYDQAAA
jgi:PhnB protein